MIFWNCRPDWRLTRATILRIIRVCFVIVVNSCVISCVLSLLVGCWCMLLFVGRSLLLVSCFCTSYIVPKVVVCSEMQRYSLQILSTRCGCGVSWLVEKFSSKHSLCASS